MNPRCSLPAESAIDIVAYQPGSVVSKVILKNPAGTVTAFAFDAGEGLSEHSAPFDALVHVIDGEARISIGGEPHVVRAGQMLKLPANIPHALQAETRFKMMLTMIKG